jgi:hypothetical protein
MLFDMEFKWILCIILMLNGIAAIWIYYDAQRFAPRVSPAAWAVSCLLLSCGTLFIWWMKTGSHRSGLVFFIILTVAIVIGGYNKAPIDQLVSDQIHNTVTWARQNINLDKESK